MRVNVELLYHAVTLKEMACSIKQIDIALYFVYFDSMIFSKMFRNEAGEWQCSECYKTSNNKNNIMEHIEASHVESPGYDCDICYKTFKTKHSL
jgi:hypothetical protein